MELKWENKDSALENLADAAQFVHSELAEDDDYGTKRYFYDISFGFSGFISSINIHADHTRPFHFAHHGIPMRHHLSSVLLFFYAII